MIYHKLDGTSSKKFKVGKNGASIQSTLSGTMELVERDNTTRKLGILDMRLDETRTSGDIPTASAVHAAIDKKIRTVSTVPTDLQEDDYIFLEKTGGN